MAEEQEESRTEEVPKKPSGHGKKLFPVGSLAAAAGAIGGCYLLTPRSTKRYSDVPTSFWAFKEIEYLSDSMNASGGVVVSGYGDGKYHPEYQITRDAMAVFIARGFSVPQ